MPILRAIKLLLLRVERFLIYRVFSLNDTPHRIALGVALGIFAAWTPTIGLQMVLVVALATLLKANKFVGVPFVWISNPATILPIYYPSYWIGAKLLGHSPAGGWQAVSEAIHFHGSLVERWMQWHRAISPIFWELWLGCLIMAIALGMLTYIIMYRMIIVYRRKLHAWQAKHGRRLPKYGETLDLPDDPGPEAVPNPDLPIHNEDAPSADS